MFQAKGRFRMLTRNEKTALRLREELGVRVEAAPMSAVGRYYVFLGGPEAMIARDARDVRALVRRAARCPG